eukprot:606443-Prymnesium_polylepis.1
MTNALGFQSVGMMLTLWSFILSVIFGSIVRRTVAPHAPGFGSRVWVRVWVGVSGYMNMNMTKCVT